MILGSVNDLLGLNIYSQKLFNILLNEIYAYKDPVNPNNYKFKN